MSIFFMNVDKCVTRPKKFKAQRNLLSSHNYFQSRHPKNTFDTAKKSG